MTVQKTVEVLQLALIDKVDDVPIVQVVDVGVQFLDTVIDMLVVVHVVVCRAKNCGSSAVAVPLTRWSMSFLAAVHRQCGRPCDHAATRCFFNSRGASDSVHRQRSWTFCCATEIGLFSVVCQIASATTKGFCSLTD